MVCKSYPRIKIVTSEIEIGLNDDYRVIPGMGEFGDRYFGTDDEWAKWISRTRQRIQFLILIYFVQSNKVLSFYSSAVGNISSTWYFDPKYDFAGFFLFLRDERNFWLGRVLVFFLMAFYDFCFNIFSLGHWQITLGIRQWVSVFVSLMVYYIIYSKSSCHNNLLHVILF